MVKEYIFRNLKPELVEKNEPPIITINKYINHKFVGDLLIDIPIFDILLVKENNTIEKRAKHVVFENDRVINAKKNLIENNINEFGNLMNESHESYSKDFEASTLDVDLIIQRSVECGALGARLTGGGFGGFTVSLIERNNFSNWYNKILNFYPAEKIFEVN